MRYFGHIRFCLWSLILLACSACTSTLTNPAFINSVGAIGGDLACWGSQAGAAVEAGLAVKGDVSSSVYKNAEALAVGLSTLCPAAAGGTGTAPAPAAPAPKP